MDLDLSDTVQQISMQWIASSKVDNPNGLKFAIMLPINVSDIVQQMKQSMFWMVSLTLDCGTLSSKYPRIYWSI